MPLFPFLSIAFMVLAGIAANKGHIDRAILLMLFSIAFVLIEICITLKRIAKKP